MLEPVVTIMSVIALTLMFFAWRFFKEARELRTRYSGITDLDAEVGAARNRLEQAKRDQQYFDCENERRRAKLNEE
jgi:hypothetical protein